MCTAMLYDPADHFEPEETKADFKQYSKLYERFMEIKKSKLLQWLTKKQINAGKSPVKSRSILQYFFSL